MSERLLNKIKGEYDFYYRLTQDESIDYDLRCQYKNISVIMAQLIESEDPNFTRNDYSYLPFH